VNANIHLRQVIASSLDYPMLTSRLKAGYAERFQAACLTCSEVKSGYLMRRALKYGARGKYDFLFKELGIYFIPSDSGPL